MLSLFVILPLFSAFLTSLLGKYVRKLPAINSVLTVFILSILSFIYIPILNISGVIVYKIGGWPIFSGISLVLDFLSLFMLIVVNFVCLMITIFSINYMNKFTSRWKFYTLFMLMLAGMNGVVITGDIFNLFVFLEVASIASYALVAFGVETEELEASFKYTVMSSFASLLILLGICLLYSYTSTLNMAHISNILAIKGLGKLGIFIMILLFAGFALKSAIVPFHAWLADAHPSAPVPISAALSGVLIKALGIYVIMRLFYNIFGINQFWLNLLMFLGVLSIMVGVLLALGQMDLKRLLAYHSISQVGYIILGLGIGTPLGIIGGLYHLFNHSVFKSLLFLNSGAIEYSTGTRDLEKMGGLREVMPVTAGTSLCASMSISGIPPFNGFFSKVLIIIACIQSGHYVYAVWAVVGSILTLSSFMKVQRYAFYGGLKAIYNKVREVPFSMRFSMVVLALICLLSSAIIFNRSSMKVLSSAADVLKRGISYKEQVFKMSKL